MTTSADTARTLHPTAGARVLFERGVIDAEGARYAGAIFTRDTRIDYAVSFGLDGTTSLTPTGDAAPAVLHDLLRALARKLQRDALASRTDTAAAKWPERILVWRPVAGY